MAVQGTPLALPFELTAIDRIGVFPFGDLVTPFEIASIDTAKPVINRFPAPPVAWAFLTDVEDSHTYPQLRITRSLTGVLVPYNDYLEPTIGQIWPR